MQTFNYKEKFSLSYFYPAIAFVLIAVLCAVFQYGIALGNFTLLSYPNSIYVSAGIAVLFVAYGFYKFRKSIRSKRNPHPIQVGESSFSFPRGDNDKVSVKFDDVTELWSRSDEDEGCQVIIYAKDNNRYEFSEDKFDNKAAFEAFETLMEQKCTNITNRK